MLAVVLLLWTWYLNRPPNYPIQPPAVPEKNALDSFQHASESLRHVYELNQVNVDWRKTEVRALDKQEIARRKQRNAKDGIPPDERLQRIQTPLSLTALLQANQTAIQILREGLGREYVIPFDPKDDYQDYYEHDRKASAHIRGCRQLLEVNALYQLTHADARTAAAALVDLLQFSTLTSHYNEYRRTTGQYQLQTLADNLSASDAREIVTRFNTVCDTRPSYAKSLERARPYTTYLISSSLSFSSHGFAEQLKWYTNRWTVGMPYMHPSPLEDRPLHINQFYAWTVPNSKVPGIADRYLAACSRAAQQPYATHAVYPPPPKDCINWTNYGWHQPEKTHLQWVLWEFQQECLRLSIALHGFRREHQRFPARLEELVADGWMEQLPVDPFTLRDTICYLSEGKSFTLYSRGPDGDDDGGKPILNVIKQRKGPSPGPMKYHEYRVLVNSQGDVVYGLHEHGEDNSNAYRI
ncbi:MAG: hypothetical protein ACYC7E_22075 [Armatimonadota bacterium]